MKIFIALTLLILFLAGCAYSQPPAAPDPQEPAGQSAPAQSPAAAQSSADPTQNPGTGNPTGPTTPMLIKGLLAGGLNKGQWMQPDEFYNSGAVDFDGYEYDVYTGGKKTGRATGSLPRNSLTGETIAGSTYEPGFDAVELTDEAGRKVEYDIAIRADWDLYLRSFVQESTEQQAYLDTAKNLLADEGLANPRTTLKQVVRADLDGDGTDEFLLAADNTVDGGFKQVKAGDNAILIFRRMAGDAAADQVVDKDIYLQDEPEISIYRLLFRVQDIADLDGDGVMEVVVKSYYYEGGSYEVYKLKGNRLVQVAANGWGV